MIRVPRQALIEFIAATTKPLTRNGPSLLTPDDARRELEEMLVLFEVLYPDEELVRVAIRGAATYKLSFTRALHRTTSVPFSARSGGTCPALSRTSCPYVTGHVSPTSATPVYFCAVFREVRRDMSRVVPDKLSLRHDQANREAVDVPAFSLPPDTPGPRFH